MKAPNAGLGVRWRPLAAASPSPRVPIAMVVSPLDESTRRPDATAVTDGDKSPRGVVGGVGRVRGRLPVCKGGGASSARALQRGARDCRAACPRRAAPRAVVPPPLPCFAASGAALWAIGPTGPTGHEQPFCPRRHPPLLSCRCHRQRPCGGGGGARRRTRPRRPLPRPRRRLRPRSRRADVLRGAPHVRRPPRAST